VTKYCGSQRCLIRERTQAGLAAARRLGRKGGRPPKLTEDDIEAAKALLANPDIAHRLGVSPATLYRYVPAARTVNTPRLRGIVRPIREIARIYSVSPSTISFYLTVIV
jgi:DNA invertase Pin-like site-specific DNA recombinase